jgi:hypothetical protein
LAGELVARGWSTKQVIRLIATSRTYRLASVFDEKAYAADPENRLLWRRTPRRLDAELLRDAMLAISERLETSPPGGSLIASLGEQEVRNQMVDRVASLDHQHRSVYLPLVRNAAPEPLELWDVADSSLVVGQRTATTVPAQMLYLLNSRLVLTAARQTAERAVGTPGSDPERISRLYHLTLQRPPTDSEVNRVLAFLEKLRSGLSTGKSRDTEERTWTAVAQALLASAEFRHID